jgi:hypothetical protein
MRPPSRITLNQKSSEGGNAPWVQHCPAVREECRECSPLCQAVAKAGRVQVHEPADYRDSSEEAITRYLV